MTLNPWRLRLLCQLEALGTVRAVASAANQSASSVSQLISRPGSAAEPASPSVGFPFDGEALSPADRLLAVADQALRSDERARPGADRF